MYPELIHNLNPIQIHNLNVQEGDILMVKVGVENMGDRMPPWIPTEDDLQYVRDLFATELPDVKAVVTHFGVDVEVVRPEDAE